MLLLITDFSDGHFYECHSNQWSGSWGWVLLHDLSLLGAWVWRSCRGTVLPGNLCSILHVHHRISGNSRGKMNLGINWELFCLITSTLEFQYRKKTISQIPSMSDWVWSHKNYTSPLSWMNDFCVILMKRDFYLSTKEIKYMYYMRKRNAMRQMILS